MDEDSDDEDDGNRQRSARPGQNAGVPERYNPKTGCTYAQIEICHNIMTEKHPSERTLKFEEHETAVLAQIIVKLQKNFANFAQLLNFKRGIKEYKEEGVEACKKELKQMHQRVCWRSIVVNELTRQEKSVLKKD